MFLKYCCEIIYMFLIFYGSQIYSSDEDYKDNVGYSIFILFMFGGFIFIIISFSMLIFCCLFLPIFLMLTVIVG
jgi:hypothetical protein